MSTPDPTLPLINRETPSYFVKQLDGVRKQGRVFSQFRNLGNHANHPSTFYVEFPVESENFLEIDANALVRALGDSNSRSPFSRREVADVIQSIPTVTDCVKLLKSCRPK